MGISLDIIATSQRSPLLFVRPSNPQKTPSWVYRLIQYFAFLISSSVVVQLLLRYLLEYPFPLLFRERLGVSILLDHLHLVLGLLYFRTYILDNLLHKDVVKTSHQHNLPIIVLG